MKTMRNLNLTFIIIMAVIFMSAKSFSQMLPAPTLRQLCQNSPIIVMADVLERSPIQGQSMFINGKLKIHIIKILKGDLSYDTVNCYLTAEVDVLPARPNFPNENIIIAFLSKANPVEQSKEAKAEENIINSEHVAYHNCIKFIDADLGDLQKYESLIYDFFSIEREYSQRKYQLTLVNWLVKCTEEPVSRWDGIFDLKNNIDFKFKLSKGQRKRIYEAVIKSNEISPIEFWMLEYVPDRLDRRILPLIKYTLYKDRNYPDYSCGTLIRIYGEITRDSSIILLANEYDSLVPYNKPRHSINTPRSNKTIKEIVAEFLMKAGVSEKDNDMNYK